MISYTVARRTNEIGIRMALGAQRIDVVAMIMREAGMLLLIGLALAAGRIATFLLFGLKPHDPITLAIASTRWSRGETSEPPVAQAVAGQWKNLQRVQSQEVCDLACRRT